MPCFCFLADFLRNRQSGQKMGQKDKFCPISRDGNIVTHKVDICGFLKTAIEFFFYRRGGGVVVAREPLWAPKLILVLLKTHKFHK